MDEPPIRRASRFRADPTAWQARDSRTSGESRRTPPSLTSTGEAPAPQAITRWQITIDWRHLCRLVGLVAWVIWRAGWRYVMMLATAVGVLSLLGNCAPATAPDLHVVFAAFGIHFVHQAIAAAKSRR
jgi:hypothetical protein